MKHSSIRYNWILITATTVGVGITIAYLFTTSLYTFYASTAIKIEKMIEKKHTIKFLWSALNTVERTHTHESHQGKLQTKLLQAKSKSVELLCEAHQEFYTVIIVLFTCLYIALALTIDVRTDMWRVFFAVHFIPSKQLRSICMTNIHSDVTCVSVYVFFIMAPQCDRHNDPAP